MSNDIHLAALRAQLRLLQATQFDSEEALKKYLKEHPGADKSKHMVKKPSGEGSGNKNEGGGENDHAEFKDKDSPYFINRSNPHFKDLGDPASWEMGKVNSLKLKLKEKESKISDPIKLKNIGQAIRQLSNWQLLVDKKSKDKPKAETKKPEDKKPESKGKSESAPKKTYTKKYNKTVSEVMDKHSLTDDDADELKAHKKKLFNPGAKDKMSDAERMRKFLSMAKPETKERMKGMSPAEFMKILGAIMDEEGEGGGKQAGLVELRAELHDLEQRQAALQDKKASMGTWLRVLTDVQTAFMAEVGKMAQSLLVDEGVEHVKIATRGSSVLLTGVAGDKALSIRYFWKDGQEIGGESSLGSAKKTGHLVALSYDPHQVAGQFIYAHLQGLLP